MNNSENLINMYNSPYLDLGDKPKKFNPYL